EADLAGNADHTDDTERPGRSEWFETNLDEILGLMHLHGVPGDEGAEVAKHDPPESAGCHRARERPFDGRPGGVGDVGTTLARYGTDGRPAVRQQPDLFGLLANEQIERTDDEKGQRAHGPARRAPTLRLDDRLQPRQQNYGADTDAREGNADGKPTPTHEPVR